MEQKSDGIFILYSTPEPDTINGLVLLETVVTEGGKCPECGTPMTLTHGKTSFSFNVHVFECEECGFDKIDKERGNCEVCNGKQ